MINDENIMKDDGQSDFLQNVPSKELCFIILWLNGQFKYHALWRYNNVNMRCHTKFTKLHYGINHNAPKRLNMYILSKYVFGDKFQGALDQWSTLRKNSNFNVLQHSLQNEKYNIKLISTIWSFPCQTKINIRRMCIVITKQHNCQLHHK
jgi:hypothetical protein